MSILAAASNHAFPIDGEGRIIVTVTKRPSRTGAVATIDCAVGLKMADSVPRNIRDTIDEMIDKARLPKTFTDMRCRRSSASASSDTPSRGGTHEVLHLLDGE